MCEDVPSLLVRVLELKPWIRQKEKGEKQCRCIVPLFLSFSVGQKDFEYDN